jgi:hypothetical protein
MVQAAASGTAKSTEGKMEGNDARTAARDERAISLHDSGGAAGISETLKLRGINPDGPVETV